MRTHKTPGRIRHLRKFLADNRQYLLPPLVYKQMEELAAENIYVFGECLFNDGMLLVRRNQWAFQRAPKVRHLLPQRFESGKVAPYNIGLAGLLPGIKQRSGVAFGDFCVSYSTHMVLDCGLRIADCGL